MPKEDKKDASDLVAEKQKSITASKSQMLRVSTIIKNNKIDSVTASAVMTAYRLKSGSRIEPAKFMKYVENFRKRKIRKSGARR